MKLPSLFSKAPPKSSSTSVQYSFWPEEVVSKPKPTKRLEEMTDQEATAAVVEALKKPFICKRCAARAKDVDSGGLCTKCASLWSWGSFNMSISTGVFTYSSSTSISIVGNTWYTSSSSR